MTRLFVPRALAGGAAALLVLIAAAHLPEAAPGKSDMPKGDESTRSRAITNQVLDAVAAEMERSLGGLRIEGAHPPYFLGYKRPRSRSTTRWPAGRHHQREGAHFETRAHVHVGSYQFDNSNFVASGRDDLDGRSEQSLPLERTASARRAPLARRGLQGGARADPGQA